MDWSKAKNIIIAALLVTNIVVGAYYFSARAGKQAELQEAAVSACSFLESHGIKVETEIPWKEQKMPVLFVNVEKAVGAVVPDEIDYGKTRICTSGGSGVIITPEKTGDVSGSIRSASFALLRLYSELSDEEKDGLVITGVELVYRLELGDFAAFGAEDTATPAWEIKTNRESYYIDAF